MTIKKTKPKTSKKAAGKETAIAEGKADRCDADVMSRMLVHPYLRHGVVASGLSNSAFGKVAGNPQFDDFSKVIKERAVEVQKGELTMATELLTAQALSLDAMMTELMRRSTINFGDYPLAAERYARLAFKAQSNCRATLEALAKLHRPREQTVRHVHVNEGGQAVVTDNFHHHRGGIENEQSGGQPHTTRTAGQSAALPSPDPLGNGVPIPSREEPQKVSNARGQRKRRA